MDGKLAKIYYGPEGYWKGFAAVKKLAEAAKVPEETAKSGFSGRRSGRYSSPRQDTFLDRDLTCPHPTRSTRRIFFFCLTTSSLAAAKFSNTPSPLLMSPAATKSLNPSDRKSVV